MVNLVVCHKLDRSIGKDPDQSRRVALEKGPTSPFFVNFRTRAKRSAPTPGILLKVRVGGLKKDFDSVQRRDDRLSLRGRESLGEQDASGGLDVEVGRTHDTASYTSRNARTQDVVKTLFVSRRSGSIWTHEVIRCDARVLTLLKKGSPPLISKARALGRIISCPSVSGSAERGLNK